MDMKQIEELMQLMKLYKIDELEFQGIKLVKSKHEPDKNAVKPQSQMARNAADVYYATQK